VRANQRGVVPFADFDNDGNQDLFVTTVRNGNHSSVTSEKASSYDVSEQAGLITQVILRGGGVDYIEMGCWTCSYATLAITPPTKRAEVDTTLAWAMAFPGHLHPDRTESCNLL